MLRVSGIPVSAAAHGTSTTPSEAAPPPGVGAFGLFAAAPAAAQVTAPSVPQDVQVTVGDSKLILTWKAPSSRGTWHGKDRVSGQ